MTPEEIRVEALKQSVELAKTKIQRAEVVYLETILDISKDFENYILGKT